MQSRVGCYRHEAAWVEGRANRCTPQPEGEPRCADCVHWESRDGLVGTCQEITDHLLQDPQLLLQGLAPCRTAASGRCQRYESSDEARELMEDEAVHWRTLRSDDRSRTAMSAN